MSYALEELLKIRLTREDRASTELTSARHAKRLAQEELDAKQKDLDKFNETKEERRDKLYDAVIGHVVSMDALDQVRDAVSTIDEQGLLLDKAKNKAQEQLEKKTSEAESAKIRFIVATKERTKIDEHKTLWLEDEIRENERLSDLEMEEFTGKKNDDEDMNH